MPSLSCHLERSREIYGTIGRPEDSSIRLRLTRNDMGSYNIYCINAMTPIPGNPKNPAMATVT